MALKTLAILAFATAAPTSCTMTERPDDGRIPNISPAAMAALPQGVDPRFLIRDSNGCYGIALEAAEVPTGIALRNDAGQQVCDA